MNDNQYPEISEEEYQTMVNSPVALEIMRRSEESMRYLHDNFLKKFYSLFPEFYRCLLETEAYLMEDL
jgi:hypothetical protein